jgi:hypothetical protein
LERYRQRAASPEVPYVSGRARLARARPEMTRFLLFSGEWGNARLARLKLTWERGLRFRGFSLCLLRGCLGARSMSGLALCACSAPGGARGQH